MFPTKIRELIRQQLCKSGAAVIDAVAAAEPLPHTKPTAHVQAAGVDLSH